MKLDQRIQDFLSPQKLAFNLYNVTKPLGLSSYSVVDVFKQITNRPAGHGGTLDPLATGDLIVGIKPATKALTAWLNKPKVYVTEVLWGVRTESHDLEAQLEVTGLTTLSDKDVTHALRLLKAKKTLVIGSYSSLKKKGVPFHRYKRDLDVSTTRLRPNVIYSYSLMAHSIMTAQQVADKLNKMLKVLKENKERYMELPISPRRQQLLLFDNLISRLSQHLDTLSSVADGYQFMVSRIKLTVGKGTYVRYIIGELSRVLSVSAVCLNIARRYQDEYVTPRDVSVT